jgi:hypothetical protein
MCKHCFSFKWIPYALKWMQDYYPSFSGTHSFQRSWLTLVISLRSSSIHLGERTCPRGCFWIHLSEIEIKRIGYMRLSHVCVARRAYLPYVCVRPDLSHLCGRVTGRISFMWVCSSAYLVYVGIKIGVSPLCGCVFRYISSNWGTLLRSPFLGSAWLQRSRFRALPQSAPISPFMVFLVSS